jgi:dTDP-4-dehydrorhamnose 3,5-epimerase
MVFTETCLEGAFWIDIERLEDERGFFARAWCRHEFQARGLKSEFVQGNISRNRARGTLRGMHYQEHPHREAKLVRCTRGAVHDVIIDLRPESVTFLDHAGTVLSEDNYRAFYVPEGFAHGFLTLTDDAEVVYQMSEFYEPMATRGIRWNDPLFEISWPEPVVVISERDRAYPDFRVLRPENTRA